jgi:hypothetical protein
MSNLIANTNKTTTNNIVEDDWFAPCVLKPVKVVEDWEKTYCGCNKCFRGAFFDHKKQPPFGRCYKIMAYDDYLAQEAKYRLGIAIKPGFKPASSAQLAEWASWLASPEAAAAAKRNSKVENQGKKVYDDYHFNGVEMERYINNLWPREKAEFLIGSKYLAYLAFAKEQQKLINDYVAKAAKVKTIIGYDVAEDAYNTLSDHIKQHGEIHEKPKKTHTRPTEAKRRTPKKMGRRAARKVRNESETSSGTVSRAEVRASKVVNVQSYSSADE